MRMIGFIPDPLDARVFEDYLLTLGTESKLDRVGAGWKVWVIEEDQLKAAREELDSFLANPSLTKYREALTKAISLRREQAVQEVADPQVFEPEETTSPAPRITIFILLATLSIGLPGIFGEQNLKKMVESFGIQGPMDAGFQLGDIRDGEIWRLITPVFIHFGPMHLLFNCLLMYQFGGLIEDRRGSMRFFFLWLLLCVFTNVAQFYLGALGIEGGKIVLFQPKVFGGMSGVIYGFVGYCWMKGEFQPGVGVGIPKSMLHFLLIWLVICWIGLLGPVANISHTAGLIMGMVLGLFPAKVSL